MPSLIGIGGAIMFVSAMLYFLNLVLTWLAPQQPAPVPVEYAEAFSGPEATPESLDCLRPWLLASVVLILVAYAPTLIHMLLETSANGPGFRVW